MGNFLHFLPWMRRFLLISPLLLLACTPETTIRGKIDEPPGQATSTAESTTATETEAPRGAMETQAEAPAGPDSNIDTSTTTQATTAPPP